MLSRGELFLESRTMGRTMELLTGSIGMLVIIALIL